MPKPKKNLQKLVEELQLICDASAGPKPLTKSEVNQMQEIIDRLTEIGDQIAALVGAV